ncbi:hypothetical protein TcWFU_002874 [Taenia crassiceps]|uniref:Uncharacterized protein n=1 Tax=Taenia crassiceps TaxID=6207 RepID=A0ABR4Q6X6_9CEST
MMGRHALWVDPKAFRRAVSQSASQAVRQRGSEAVKLTGNVRGNEWWVDLSVSLGSLGSISSPVSQVKRTGCYDDDAVALTWCVKYPSWLLST